MKKRMLFHVILLLTLTWGGFSGCGGDEIVSPTETEVVEVTEVTEVTGSLRRGHHLFQAGGHYLRRACRQRCLRDRSPGALSRQQ